MNDKKPNINEVLYIVEEAKEHEKKGFYYEASNEYQKAGDFFKEINQIKLFAQCLAAQYVNMIKYYLATRDIEVFSINIFEFFIEQINMIMVLDFNKRDKYDLAIHTYQELEKIFSDHHMNKLVDIAYFKKTKLYHKLFWEEAKYSTRLFAKIKNIFISVLHLFFNKYCGHGVSSVKPICISLLVVTAFSLIFCCLNLINYAPKWEDHTIGLLQSFYFSVVTFTTLGFGDIVPINCIGQILVTIEVMLGYLMLYTLVAILARKFTR